MEFNCRDFGLQILFAPDGQSFPTPMIKSSPTLPLRESPKIKFGKLDSFLYSHARNTIRRTDYKKNF